MLAQWQYSFNECSREKGLLLIANYFRFAVQKFLLLLRKRSIQ